MKILVTGGAGFIGSHLVDGFIENGHEVIIVDDLMTGIMDNVNKKAKFYKCDITSKELENVFKENKDIDVVVHHAAHISIRNSLEKPIFDANINIIGSLNILELCKKYNVKKIVYASSGGAVYGEPEYLPCDEKHVINPISHYGVSKHTVEHYLWLYKYLYKIDYAILRYANIYGPRQDPRCEAGVISIFLENLLNGKECQIFGDGKQTRDFVYVKDVVEANLLALYKSGLFNISSNTQTSVNEIYALLVEIMNIDSKPVYSDEVPGDLREIYLDYSSANKLLKWNPKDGIKEGLKETVEWFKNK